jgi:6-phospho-beta-glucosidase
VHVDDEDYSQRLIADDQLLDGLGFPRELIRTLGAVPSYYLRYYYCTGQEVQVQRQGHHRALEVIDIENQLLAMYADPALDHKPALLEQRGGAYYSEAAAALVTSLFTGDGAQHYVNLRNAGTLAGLPDEAVVEVPATVDRDGAHSEPVPPFAPEMLGLVQAVTAYEVLAIEAAVTGDRDTALRALMAHPLVREWDLAVAVWDELLTAHAPYLPQFAGVATQ